MKTNLFFAMLLGSLLGAQTFSNVALTAIPDNSTVGSQSDIAVALVQTIADASKVTVNVDLTHTWCGDITVALVVPGSTGIGANALIKRLGSTTATGVGSSTNFLAGNVLSFNSLATSLIEPPVGTNLSVPAGTYLPTASATLIPTDYTVANLNTLFNNLAVNGTWSLKLFDNAAGDTGSLNNWQIVFNTGAFLGVDTQSISNPGLSVMQNPFQETLNLQVNTTVKDLKFDIYSMDGKKVYSYKQLSTINGELKVPTANWSPGIYILKPMVNGQSLMSIKLIKK